MYVTEDGGASWRPSNHGVRAEFLPDKYPEFGQCVHKIAQARRRSGSVLPAEPLGPVSQRRSRRDVDRRRQRRAVRLRVPARPSIRAIADSRVDRAARVGRVPLHARGQAAASSGPPTPARRGSRSTDGLPQADAYETVLRDALAVDTPRSVRRLLRHAQRQAVRLRPTKAGSWQTLAEGLPPIVAVKAAVV
mgnify:CR=1 FL=1